MLRRIFGLLVRVITEGLYLFGSSDGLFEGEEVGGELSWTEIAKMVISIEDCVIKQISGACTFE